MFKGLCCLFFGLAIFNVSCSVDLDDDSTSTSVAAIDDCGNGRPLPGHIRRILTSTDRLIIPDNNATGVNSVINFPAGLSNTFQVATSIDITHTFRGDLVIQVISPAGQTATLSNRSGGSSDNFVTVGQDISASFTTTASPSGQWRLFVRDLAAVDVGTINSFCLAIDSSN